MSEWSDIGEALRGERETLGWSLRDVAHRTRIPIQTLHGLEENDYSNFPSPTYAKSFLSQYSEHLGIDVSEWLDAFDTGNVFSNLDSYDYLKDHDEHLGEEVIPARKVKKAVVPAHAPAPAPAPASSFSLQPLVVFLISAILITGGAFGFLHLSNRLAETVGPEDRPAAGDTPALAPAPSVVPSRPAPPQHPAPGRNPAPAVADSGSNDSPLGIRSAGGDPNPSPEILLSAPPPRAVIVEE